MSRRREVLGRLKTLREISGIMSALKNISLMETRKITRFLSSQQRVVANIETAAEDFLHFHPALRPGPDHASRAWLLIGSERGFCGDFNQSLLKAFDARVPTAAQGGGRIIAVGRKLCMEMGERYPGALMFDGPGVADEVHGLLSSFVQALDKMQHESGGCALIMMHHVEGGAAPRVTPLLPPFERLEPADAAENHAFPPRLTLAPDVFFAELVRHYLFAALHAGFFTSLMAEHQRRVKHLENATRRLDEQSALLLQKSNVLRQEEITEEIEEIMLGSAGL